MPYDVVAYEADENAMLLSAEQEGLFHRLLRRAWMNGSIPDDVNKCAVICRVTKLQMKRAWTAIRPLWIESEPGRLVNAKQESEREWKAMYSTAQSERGRLGGVAKSRQNKKRNVASAKQAPNARLASLPLPSPSLPKEANIINNSPTVVSAASEKRAAQRDEAADFFSEKHHELLHSVYITAPKDFVQLARLRNANGVSARASPDGWQEAVMNYFASPLSCWTLADLAARFAVFRNTALDRYGKPINHAGGGDGKPKENANDRATKDFLRRALAPKV